LLFKATILSFLLKKQRILIHQLKDLICKIKHFIKK
jgi:hypothetical protein